MAHRHILLILIIFDLGGSTGQLNQQPQPRINLPRHVDVVSSDDTQPSWSGLHHTQVNSNGQASSSGVYSGPPGSNNVGSLGRSVMRRLHDSGFSPDASRGDHRWTGKIFSGFKKNSVHLKSLSDHSVYVNIVPHYALTSVLISKSLTELAVFSCLDPKIGVCLASKEHTLNLSFLGPNKPTLIFT